MSREGGGEEKKDEGGKIDTKEEDGEGIKEQNEEMREGEEKVRWRKKERLRKNIK